MPFNVKRYNIHVHINYSMLNVTVPLQRWITAWSFKWNQTVTLYQKVTKYIHNNLTVMLATIGCCLIFCMGTRFVHGHWPPQLKYVISSLLSPRRESNHATSKAVSCAPHTLLTFISYGDKSGKDLFPTNILVLAANFFSWIMMFFNSHRHYIVWLYSFIVLMPTLSEIWM